MKTYYDTGVLVPLYVEEAFSDAITSCLAAGKQPVPVNLLHQLELENALRLKVFRGEVDGVQCRAVLNRFQSDIAAGRFVVRQVHWIGVFDATRRLSAGVTAEKGCRTLDLIHVALALHWDCPVFVTADDRQMEAARFAGLETIDLRDTHRAGRKTDAGGAVREKSARHSAGKRLRAK